MSFPDDYHGILQEKYPDIWLLWCEAVDADFESEFLYHEGRYEEADKMAKKHEELWNEYCFAAKLVLTEPD